MLYHRVLYHLKGLIGLFGILGSFGFFSAHYCLFILHIYIFIYYLFIYLFIYFSALLSANTGGGGSNKILIAAQI